MPGRAYERQGQPQMVKTSFFVQAGALAALALGLFAGCAPANNASNTPSEPTNAGSGAAGGGTTAARPSVTAPPIEVSGDVIKIGLVYSKNGSLRPWGEDSLKGVQMAVDKVNAAGGIDGKKIELRSEDSASTADAGKTAAEKLASEGVVGMLGEVASGISKTMADVTFSKGIPQVMIGATKTDLTTIGNNLFRVCYTDDFQGPVMAKFAHDELGLRKIAIFTDQAQPYSTGLSASFRKKFTELGGEIVDEQFYKTGDTNFAGLISNVKQKSPDGLFLSGYFSEVGPLARQIREAGMTTQKLLGGDGWDSSELLTSGGEGILGGFFCNHYNNMEDRPEVKAFLDEWKKKYNGTTPATTMGALAYDAANLMFDAITRASAEAKAANKPLNTAMIIAALENTENFQGVSGAITLKGAAGNPEKRALVVEVTREGQKFAKAYEPSELK